MNHKNATLSIATNVAAFAIPQQALAGGHKHNSDSVDVSQT
ncbi:MAG: hypothetical protein WBE34_17065 [Candidatus Nitrosopolaris sp.]